MTLTAWPDALPVAEARLLSVCASTRWAREVAHAGPFRSEDDLLAAAARAFDLLEPADWLEAFAAHSRIADPVEGTERVEQAGLEGATDAELAELRAGNAAYEARFGHVFLIRARGRSAAEILAALRERLERSPEEELAAAGAEEREIVTLRLKEMTLIDDLHSRIVQLARFNADVAAGGITREIYTAEYAQATEYVSELMRDAGLEVRLDAAGNLFGRWAGRSPELPRVLTGSHYDTTLNAGRLDGVLGVLGAIEAVRRLRRAGFAPRRTIEIVGFAGEEPRFGAGCLGSRAMTGQLSREDLDAARDRNGISIAEAMRASGFDPDRIAEARIVPEEVYALVELHIEQGSVLETDGLPVGVVEHIAAPHDHRVTLTGMARHAGSTPMTMRRDALAGAAEIVLAVERLARGSASGTTVGTVGVLDLEPGAINIIPGQVVMDIDVRDRDLAVRDAVVAELHDLIDAVARDRELDVSVETITHDVPQACAPRVVDAVRGACEALEIPHRGMVSGAYHDSMVLGAQVPMGMIFVPSIDGISHHPDEDTDPEHLDLGVAVLTATLERLAA